MVALRQLRLLVEINHLQFHPAGQNFNTKLPNLFDGVK